MKELEKTSSIKQGESYFNQFSFLAQDKKIFLEIPKHLNIQLFEEDGGFIFDGNNGLMYTLNPTSVFILSTLMGAPQQMNLSKMSELLCQSYDVKPKDAEDDLIEFFCLLNDFGIEVGCV